MNEVLARLKQRKLVQWALAYIAASFALIQVLDVVAQRFGWPDQLEKFLILALALGFFVTLVLAWYHGERGAQKVSSTELVILALLLAIGGALVWRMAQAPHDATTVSVAATATEKPAAITDKSIAVLPFENDSGQQDQQYFSDALSQDLITALTQFQGLKVISRDSAFQFRGSKDSPAVIAAKLGVAHLLEGSVQHQGDAVRISVTLVDAADGSTLWSQHYDKPYKDLFALQDDITHAVADALQAKLLTAPGAVAQSERPPGGNLAAWQAYQQGQFYAARSTQADVRKAIDAYTAATRLDPRYAAAYTRVSFDWNSLARTFLGGAAQQQAYAEARAAADTALRLDQDLAPAHLARGYVLKNADFDWHGAQAEYQRAAQLAPNDPSVLYNLGNMDATLGRVQSAVELTRKAVAGDPLHATWYSWLSTYLSALGQLDAAQQAIAKAIELQPAAADFHYLLAVVEILRGDAKAALAAAQQETDPSWREVALALALQIGPDHAAADAALKALIEHYADLSSYRIAEVYALRRDSDDMFQWLDRAWTARDPGIGNLLVDPFILRYRNDPRFAAFCKKIGLPTTTDAQAMP